ncbi:MAG TPA: hypothetical protein VM802_09565 [Chitinophaga sp.]|uniref:hypothetical protein n=1 Tax=Chitinophaga sp. TaxID=1869181 RepID=UPI002BD0B9DF|nr:hypothetical protein [Chitinophaga sp.]HVI45109.1 hypothetical protein [Chitinophaga sp.]
MNRLITTVIADTMDQLTTACWFKRSSLKGSNLMLRITLPDERSREEAARMVTERLSDYVTLYPSAPAVEVFPLNSLFMNYQHNTIIAATPEEKEDNPEEETALLSRISRISVGLLKDCMPEDESDLIQLALPYYAAILRLQTNGADGVAAFYNNLAATVISTYPDSETTGKRIRAAFDAIFDDNREELCTLMEAAYQSVADGGATDPCLTEWLEITASLISMPPERSAYIFTGLLRLLTNQLGLDIVNSINVMLIVARATEVFDSNTKKYACIPDKQG